MKQNPVYSREMRVSQRSLRLPMIVFLFNGILFLVTLLNMYTAVTQVKANATIQYSSFMEIYGLVASIEFIMLFFIVPAVTASSISGERERQTLDLMLTTQMSAVQIVTGKLMGALSTLFLLILSSFPAIAMVFVYGGITWSGMLALLICYGTVAFFAGSVGLCCSSLMKRSTVSTVVTYAALIAVVGGTYFINRFALSLSTMNVSAVSAAYSMGESAAASSGGLFYLFLLNPAVTFLAIIGGQTGSARTLEQICLYFGMNPEGFIIEHWGFLSICIQLLLGVLLIFISVRCIEPVKGKAARSHGFSKKDKAQKKEKGI